ncbi:MAG: glycosyltransferase [Scytonema sp. PMC 1069.18]|nr:glycosyltransferase [Scytonema sp. PMC 1069.18]MEC4885585.1 glycosyltransferase [Scytonema sp. PMC 1070.18]
MNIISRIQLPTTAENFDLYFKFETGRVNFNLGDRQIILPEDSTLSLNTYFNSIYEYFYTKYTALSSLYYLLKLEGDFEVIAYRETSNRLERELISHQKILQCQLSDYVKIDLPELRQNQEAGRIYLEITSLNQQGLFAEGLLVTEQEKRQDVSLGIISCTFKKEVYIKKTVNTILQDSALQRKNFKIFVVDNGRTLNKNDFEDDRVGLILNRNVGGSGGFTKGLIEGLQEEKYTHFLFMDDDIELDSEAIYKLFSLYEYAKEDFAIAGSMLDLYKKHLLYEAGALYNKDLDDEGNAYDHQFTVVPLKHNLDLSSPTSLNLLLVEDDIDYGGFWFFAFSKEIVEKAGLLLPLFIKIDDMEFGLRIKKYLNIVAFPSVAVWHEPFYAKKPGWDIYYHTRNNLIANSIHNSLDYIRMVKDLTIAIFFNVLIFDYNSAIMFLKAFQDYMQGPNFIVNNDPEILHSKICGLSKSHKSQTVLSRSVLDSKDYQTTKLGKIQKLGLLLTLNGHFLPQFLIRNESAIVRYGLTEQDHDSICKGFARKKIIFIQEPIPFSYHNELDRRAGINILLAWFQIVMRSILQWSNVSAEWKKAAKNLTSVQFWQSYLESSLSDNTQTQLSDYVNLEKAAYSFPAQSLPIEMNRKDAKDAFALAEPLEREASRSRSVPEGREEKKEEEKSGNLTLGRE